MNYQEFNLLKLNGLDKEKIRDSFGKIKKTIKSKKVSLRALILTGAIAFGVGNISFKPSGKYDVSDLYVASYTDYYGEDKLAVLVKKNTNILNEDGKPIDYYEEINGLFNSEDVELKEIEAFFTCLTDDELEIIKGKNNVLSIDAINELMEDVNSKYQIIDGSQEDIKLYDVNNYYVGVYYNNGLNTWVCDIFSRVNTNVYNQYKKLYKASTFNGDVQYINLVVTSKLVENLSSDDLKIINKNGGLSENQLESIKNNINNQILAKAYKPLNNYLLNSSSSLADSTESKTNVVTSNKEETNNLGTYLSDLYYAIYYDENGVKKVIIYSGKNQNIVIGCDGIVRYADEVFTKYELISTDKIYNLIVNDDITSESYKELLSYYALSENPLTIIDLQKIALGFCYTDIDKITHNNDSKIKLALN